jgi:hypothetical protein
LAAHAKEEAKDSIEFGSYSSYTATAVVIAVEGIRECSCQMGGQVASVVFDRDLKELGRMAVVCTADFILVPRSLGSILVSVPAAGQNHLLLT